MKGDVRGIHDNTNGIIVLGQKMHGEQLYTHPAILVSKNEVLHLFLILNN